MDTLILYKNKDELNGKLSYINTGNTYFIEAPVNEPIVLIGNDAFDLTRLRKEIISYIFKAVIEYKNKNHLKLICENSYCELVLDDPITAYDNILNTIKATDVAYFIDENSTFDDYDDYDYLGFIFVKYKYDKLVHIEISVNMFEDTKISLDNDIPRKYNYRGKSIFFTTSPEYFNNDVLAEYQWSRYIITDNNINKTTYSSYAYCTYADSNFITYSIHSPYAKSAINTILNTPTTKPHYIWIQTSGECKVICNEQISYDDIINETKKLQPTMDKFISIKIQNVINDSIKEIARISSQILLPDLFNYVRSTVSIKIDELPSIGRI